MPRIHNIDLIMNRLFYVFAESYRNYSIEFSREIYYEIQAEYP